MSETSKIRPAVFCRRSILRSLLFTVFGVVTFRLTTENRAIAAETKATQQAVDYRDKAEGASHCDNCKYFKPPSSCYIVEGSIAPTGWCSKYAR